MASSEVSTSINLPEVMTPDQIVDLFRAVRERIPEFTQLSVPDRQSIRRVANVNVQFVQAAINTIGMSEHVRGALGVDALQVQQQTNDGRYWTAVEDELRAMLEGVAAANLVRRHRVGLIALQTYKIALQLARRKENASLLPQIEVMKGLNKFGPRKRVKSSPPEPAPPQQPAPNPGPKV